MLERDETVETRHRAAELIVRSATRLGKVVDDLVDLTRLRGEGLRIAPARIRLQDAVLTAADTCGPAIATRQQVLQVDIPVEPPLWIDGDAVRLDFSAGELLRVRVDL